MGNVFMNVSITNYTGKHRRTNCAFYESIDDGEMVRHSVTVMEAYKLVWELVKAGATKEVRNNQFNNDINYIDVHYYMRH